MNDAMIEKLLLQAPQPAPPADLLGLLQVQIVLPARPVNGRQQHFLRRWFPALAFGLFLLSCVILVGVQATWLGQLRRDNQNLRAAAADLDSLRRQHADHEAQRLQSEELNRLRADNQELQRLQAEAVQLRNAAASAAASNQSSNQTAPALTQDSVDEQFFAIAKERQQRIACVNNLKQIGLAIRIWSGDHGDRTPTSFVVMSNELSTVKVLVCPGDTAKIGYTALGWGDFRDEMSSYELRTTGGGDDRFPESIISKCPIHNNYGLADGSVQMINPAKYLEVADPQTGRTYLKQRTP